MEEGEGGKGLEEEEKKGKLRLVFLFFSSPASDNANIEPATFSRLVLSNFKYR
jgi:hypothetical protein